MSTIRILTENRWEDVDRAAYARAMLELGDTWTETRRHLLRLGYLCIEFGDGVWKDIETANPPEAVKDMKWYFTAHDAVEPRPFRGAIGRLFCQLGGCSI